MAHNERIHLLAPNAMLDLIYYCLSQRCLNPNTLTCIASGIQGNLRGLGRKLVRPRFGSSDKHAV